MKNLLIFIFILLVSSSFAQNEVEFEYNKSIKLHPVALGISGYQLSYEHYLKNRKSSIVITPMLVFKDGSQETRTGAELMGQYRFYLSHLNREEERTFWGIYNFGFYSSVYGLGYYLDETYLRGYYNPDTFEYEMSAYDLNVSSFEIGTMLGVQVDITKRIVLDLNVGGGIRKSKVSDTYLDENGNGDFQEYSPFEPSYTGVKPKFGLSIGITL